MHQGRLRSAESGASSTVGIVLLVAITVILVSVIGYFVLELGETTDELQPTSSFTTSVDSDEEVTLTLTNGDSIDFDELVLRGDGVDESFTDWEDLDGVDSGEEWNAGQSVTVNETHLDGSGFDDGTVTLVWEDSSATSSANLYSFDAPA